MRNPLGRHGWPWLLLAILLVLAWRGWTPTPTTAPASSPVARPDVPATPLPDRRSGGGASGLPAFLPAEAADTIARIRHGGPFPHAQDGSVFGNREGHLPRQPRGWYREYTVETPGLRHRGARRIVTGGDPPQAWYYTDDHYETFRRFDPGAPRP